MQKHLGAPLRAAAWALAAAGLLSACGGSDDAAPTPYTLTLLHINDHHSTLESKSKTLQLGAGGSATVAVAVDAGGLCPRERCV